VAIVHWETSRNNMGKFCEDSDLIYYQESEEKEVDKGSSEKGNLKIFQTITRPGQAADTKEALACCVGSSVEQCKKPHSLTMEDKLFT
jgi:hypothetical protein